MSSSRASVSRALLAAALAAADDSSGVLSRAQLRALGIGRDRVAHHVAAGRWRLHGRHTVATHSGELSDVARAWRAVHESGGDARVDGVTSLQLAGVKGLADDVVHVSLHHLCQVPVVSGVVAHKVSRRVEGELVLPGLPRTPPALAALRAAQWAVSDRQAALFLVLPVQQRVVTPDQLRRTHALYRGRRRRALVTQLVDDLADGAHSLGELDFARMCRRRGLPEPSRQVVRVLADGRRYLDAGWEDLGLFVEIDGAGHAQGLEPGFDHLRQNAVTLGGETVLRMTVIGLRLHEDAFMDQVVRAHRALRSLRSA